MSTNPRAVIVTAVTLVILAGTSRAYAEPTKPTYHLGGGAHGRITSLDFGASEYMSTLETYDYESPSPFAPGLFLFAAYRGAALADVGVQAEYAYSSHGHPNGASVSMRSHMRQLGVFVRPRARLHRRIDLGLRLEGGIVHTDTILRQQSLRVITPYTRAQVDLLIEGDVLGMGLLAGYMRGFRGDAYDPYLAPPTGGLSFAISVYRRM